MRTFTVFIREPDNTGTTFISAATAETQEEAVAAVLAECRECWETDEDLHVLVRRSSEWEAGTMGKGGCLQARRHKDGRVEIFAPRDYREPLWIETHRDHWHAFAPNDQVEARRK